jgi:membrane protein
MEADRETTGRAYGSPSPPDVSEPEPASASATSRIARARRRIDDGVDQAQTWAESTRQQLPVVDLGLTLIGRVRFVQLSLVAGYLAMRFFVLLFPLAYVVIAGFGLATSRQDVLDASEEVGVSGAVANSIADATATSERGHWIALIIGLMATAWAGRGTLRALRIAHAEAWRLPVPKTSYASAGGLPLAALLLATVVYGSWITHLRTEGHHPLLAFALHAIVIGAVWLVVASRMPHAEGAGWVDLAPGAALVGLAAPALNLAVSLYFAPRVARTQATYGALGVGVVLLTYLLVISWLITLSAELNSGILAWRRERAGGQTRPADEESQVSVALQPAEGEPAPDRREIERRQAVRDRDRERG